MDKFNTDYIQIDHIVGSFIEEISAIGKTHKLVFEPFFIGKSEDIAKVRFIRGYNKKKYVVQAESHSNN